MFTHPVEIAAVILITLILFAEAVALQVFLSKGTDKWLGRILPAITLILSIYRVINSATVSYADNGGLGMLDLGTLDPGSVLKILIITNIPTGVFMVIYAAVRAKVKRYAQIDKMNIQDL